MSEGESGNGNGGSVTAGAGSWTPPYGAFGTLVNTVERLAKEGGIPNQIDRSYLSNLPGSAQTELLQSMRALGLIDEQLRPTRDLQLLVEEGESGRGGVMSVILSGKYEGPLALGAFATQQQLEDEFRKYGVNGNTLRKAIRFFLAAAKWADVPVSPHFRSPKVDTTARAPRKPRTPAGSNGGDGKKPDEKPEAPAVERHPLIQGLFQELPPVGTEFTDQQQTDWLDLAKVALKVIYKTPATKAKRPTEGGDPD